MKIKQKIVMGSILLAISVSSFANGYDKSQLRQAYMQCKSQINKNTPEDQANKQFADCMNAKGFHLNN